MKSKNSNQKSSIPNPALKLLSALVGEWDTVGKHPLFPGTVFHGHVSFTWIEGGAFLMMHSEVMESGAPSGVAVIGSDDSLEECSMLYFDERRVSRVYRTTLYDNVWKMWRSAPGFSQRFTGTFTNGGNSIIGIWELSNDGSNWNRDLELTYSRTENV
jgi:hypothetical protein